MTASLKSFKNIRVFSCDRTLLMSPSSTHSNFTRNEHRKITHHGKCFPKEPHQNSNQISRKQASFIHSNWIRSELCSLFWSVSAMAPFVLCVLAKFIWQHFTIRLCYVDISKPSSCSSSTTSFVSIPVWLIQSLSRRNWMKYFECFRSTIWLLTCDAAWTSCSFVGQRRMANIYHFK